MLMRVLIQLRMCNDCITGDFFLNEAANFESSSCVFGTTLVPTFFQVRLGRVRSLSQRGDHPCLGPGLRAGGWPKRPDLELHFYRMEQPAGKFCALHPLLQAHKKD